MDKDDQEWLNAHLSETVDTGEDFGLEVWLSSDGKHSVKVAPTAENRKAALTYAEKLFDRILLRYGSKQSHAVKEYKNAEEQGKGEGWCAIHKVQMIEKDGKFGKFFSHYVGRFPDGGYCNGKEK